MTNFYTMNFLLELSDVENLYSSYLYVTLILSLCFYQYHHKQVHYQIKLLPIFWCTFLTVFYQWPCHITIKTFNISNNLRKHYTQWSRDIIIIISNIYKLYNYTVYEQKTK